MNLTLLVKSTLKSIIIKSPCGKNSKRRHYSEQIGISSQKRNSDLIAAIFKYNGFEAILPQTIALLNQKDIAFPSEMYPQLIQYFEKHIGKFGEVKEFLEGRFYWLVKQNPNWAAFSKDITPSQIEKIRGLELKALALQYYAQSGEEEAIGYIYNEWENFSTHLQAAFLKRFTPEQTDLTDSLFDKIALSKSKDTYRHVLRYYSRTKNEEFLEMLSGHIEEAYL